MKDIKIVYIDDQIDFALSQYLETTHSSFCHLVNCEINITYDEITYQEEDGYASLFLNPNVTSANIILVDNRLYQHKFSGSGKFSGKQFKIILRKILPFVIVIIITQDKTSNEQYIVHKYDEKDISQERMTAYYNEVLMPTIAEALKEVLEFESLADELSGSNEVEKMLVERVINSLNGDNTYDELSKSDIDTLVAVFSELKDKLSDE